jgi:hypothetical protein
MDQDLSKKFQETSVHKKQKLTHSVEGLTMMANNVISYENSTTKAIETSANYSTKMCNHPECNKLKTASHTSSKCWRKHRDLCPEHLRSKFGKRKNNYFRGHRKSKEGQENFNNNTTDKRTPSAYLKKARKFLKQRNKANHAREPDYSKDDNMVLNLAYFNYAKANKLKVKAGKRIKKLLSTGNGDNNPKKLRNKTNQSDMKQDKECESTKFDGPKKRCGKCGKWGNHTAEECTASGKVDNSSKLEEANLASSGKGKTPVRRVEN